MLEDALSEKTYEFETLGDATVREIWRATVADFYLTDEELRDALYEELHAGRCEFVSEQAEDERNREIREESIEEAGPVEPAWTVIGIYLEGDSFHQRYATTVYTHNGPEAAEALAQAACREDNQAEDGEDLIEIAAVIEGEVKVAA